MYVADRMVNCRPTPDTMSYKECYSPSCEPRHALRSSGEAIVSPGPLIFGEALARIPGILNCINDAATASQILRSRTEIADAVVAAGRAQTGDMSEHFRQSNCKHIEGLIGDS